MKRILLLCSSFLCLTLSAQTTVIEENSTPKNIIKTNVMAYAFRNFNVAYEYAFKKSFSLNVGLNYTPKGSVPFAKQFIPEDNEIENINDIEISNFAFTIEPRFYLGKGFGKGFYFAPYYRYSKIDLSNYEVDVKYNHRDLTVNLGGNASANSFGLMIGTQWFLGEKNNWVIDWWIVGAHYGFSKGNFSGISDKLLTPLDQQKIKEDLENQNIPFVKYKVTTHSKGANIELDGPWAGLRSGLSIGYRF